MKSLGIRSTCRFSATQQDTFFKAAAGYSRRQSQRKCLQHFRLRSDRPGRTTVMVSGGAGSSAVNGAAPQRDQGEPSGPPPERRLALLKRIAAFAGPALSIPLADPLMSLIDTIAIGQFADTTQLAALGPNAVVFNFTTYLVSALSVATVTVVAEKLRQGNPEEGGQVVSASMLIAFAIGVVLAGVFKTFAVPIIQATGCAAEMVGPAATYMRIRALSMPATLVLMMAQAALIAQKDAVRPLLGVLAACVLNMVGDVVLITQLGWGLVGAAVATLASQTLHAIVLVYLLKDQGEVHPSLRRPQQRELSELAGTCGPTTLIYLAKNACYLLVQTTATGLHPLLVAAHQPIYGLWSLLSFGHVPTEQAALAYLPGVTSRREASELIWVLLVLGATIGVVTAIAAGVVPIFAPRIFSPDVRLWPHMCAVVPQVAFSMFICALDVAASGILLAQKDLGYMAKTMAVNLVTLAVFFNYARRAGWGLAGVWWGLVIFFGLRAVASLYRIANPPTSETPVPKPV